MCFFESLAFTEKNRAARKSTFLKSVTTYQNAWIPHNVNVDIFRAIQPYKSRKGLLIADTVR